jgi:hypothetical protein
MPELMNLNHPGSEISHLGSEKAEQIAQRLGQYEPNSTPAEEAREAIRAAGTMANLTLFAWDAVQQFVGNGVEGGQARERVEKAFRAIELWLRNIRMAIDIAEPWHDSVALPFSLDELRHLENQLQQVHSAAEQLRSFVNGPPPALPQGVLEKVEAIGQADDKIEYLDAEVFLARTRSHKGT